MLVPVPHLPLHMWFFPALSKSSPQALLVPAPTELLASVILPLLALLWMPFNLVSTKEFKKQEKQTTLYLLKLLF